jgi:hypothetical protein
MKKIFFGLWADKLLSADNRKSLPSFWGKIAGLITIEDLTA